MKLRLLALAAAGAAAALVTAPKDAEAYPVYPWCVDYGGRGGGGTNCYFATWDQCRQAASGNGGVCYQNPFYGAPGYGGTDVRPPRRKHRRAY